MSPESNLASKPQNPPAHLMVEREPGHGHGMSRNRTPKTDRGLPHDDKREGKQPYSREVEEYSGGVAHGPGGAGEQGSDKSPGKDA